MPAQRRANSDQILGILGGNFVRVLSEIWRRHDTGEAAAGAAG